MSHRALRPLSCEAAVPKPPTPRQGCGFPSCVIALQQKQDKVLPSTGLAEAALLAGREPRLFCLLFPWPSTTATRIPSAVPAGCQCSCAAFNSPGSWKHYL